MKKSYENLYRSIGICIDELVEKGFRFETQDKGNNHYIQVVKYHVRRIAVVFCLNRCRISQNAGYENCKLKDFYLSEAQWRNKVLDYVDELMGVKKKEIYKIEELLKLPKRRHEELKKQWASIQANKEKVQQFDKAWAGIPPDNSGAKRAMADVNRVNFETASAMKSKKPLTYKDVTEKLLRWTDVANIFKERTTNESAKIKQNQDSKNDSERQTPKCLTANEVRKMLWEIEQARLRKDPNYKEPVNHFEELQKQVAALEIRCKELETKYSETNQSNSKRVSPDAVRQQQYTTPIPPGMTTCIQCDLPYSRSHRCPYINALSRF